MTEQRPPEQERAREIAEFIRTRWNPENTMPPLGIAETLEALATAHQQSLERERALREFVFAHTLVESGITDFDLHAETVERFRRASEHPAVQEIIREALAANPSEEEAETAKGPGIT